jgi:hypothetical protein
MNIEVIENCTRFAVREDKIGSFLEMLDPGESATVTYARKNVPGSEPMHYYIVVLDRPTNWDLLDVHGDGITPMPN